MIFFPLPLPFFPLHLKSSPSSWSQLVVVVVVVYMKKRIKAQFPPPSPAVIYSTRMFSTCLSISSSRTTYIQRDIAGEYRVVGGGTDFSMKKKEGRNRFYITLYNPFAFIHISLSIDWTIGRFALHRIALISSVHLCSALKSQLVAQFQVTNSPSAGLLDDRRSRQF